MKKLLIIIGIFLLSACSAEPDVFFGDPSSLPEGKEISIEGTLERTFEKTGSYGYHLNGMWLTFNDDRVSAEDFVGKKVVATGTVHHFNNCPPRQDPDMPEQCMIAEQLQVKNIQEL